jgi:hypothetical protein
MLVILLTLDHYLPVRAYSEVHRRLAVKLGQDGVAPPGTFVSLAPHGEVRLYEGFTNWDFGFLELRGDRLIYVGEQGRFSLTREQVTDVRLGPGMKRWWSYDYLYISWKGPDGAGTFNLRAGDVRSMRQLARGTAALEQAVRKWWEQPGAAEGPSDGPPPPAFGEVTSAPAAAVIQPSGALMQVAIAAALAAVLGWALGLPFGEASWLGYFPPAAAALGVVFLLVPIWANRRLGAAPGGASPAEAADRPPG